MDGDPAVEPLLDTFSRILPLPYRVALIIVLGKSSPIASIPSSYSSHAEVPKTQKKSLTRKHHRYMGLGPKPALPLPHKNRRPSSNPLPIAQLAYPPLPPPLLLPHRHLPNPPPPHLPPLLLGRNLRLRPLLHPPLVPPPKPLPTPPSRRFHRAAPLPQSLRPLPHFIDPQAHKHRRHRRSAGR